MMPLRDLPSLMLPVGDLENLLRFCLWPAQRARDYTSGCPGKATAAGMSVQQPRLSLAMLFEARDVGAGRGELLGAQPDQILQAALRQALRRRLHQQRVRLL